MSKIHYIRPASATKKPINPLRLLLSVLPLNFFQFPSNNSSPGLSLSLMKNDLKAHTERDNPSGAQCSPASTIEGASV